MSEIRWRLAHGSEGLALTMRFWKAVVIERVPTTGDAPLAHERLCLEGAVLARFPHRITLAARRGGGNE
jgi:hypothetical protein